MVATKAREYRQGEHSGGLFATEAERFDLIASFIADGLARGERATYLTASTSPDDLIDSLRFAGIAVDEPLRSGQLTIGGARETFAATLPFDPARMISSITDATAAALADGWAGLHLAGDVLLHAIPGGENPRNYEELLDDEISELALSALCMYDARHYEPASLAEVMGVHVHTYAASSLSCTQHDGEAGWHLEGELDLANLDAFGEFLESAASSGRDLVLDFAAVRFIDVASTGVLVSFTQHRPVGQHVYLEHVPPMLQRILALGWGGGGIGSTRGPHRHAS